VLPAIEGARIERSGDQRWLVVKGTPESVWPKVHDFWVENGWSLVRDAPDVGIMETDWREDRTKIPQDILRQWVGKLIDGMYSSSTRDKYRTRLEKGVEPGTTEVYVTHRGVEEVFTTHEQDSTKWQPRPHNQEYEAEMLQRIMVKLGAPETPKVIAASGVTATSASASAEPRNAVLQGNTLVLNDSFDRAWRRVGLALDRTGFTVEDRDRSKGVYFVRYIDPDASTESQTKKGFWESLKFWKSDPKVGQPQYRVHVGDAGGGLSQVTVENSQGAAETSSTGKRILSLLQEQLK
jgi:outer membrane protein assembly factor BamC